MFDKDKKPFSR